MGTTILVPLDGSPLAERALPFAARLARTDGVAVLLGRAALEVDEIRLAHAEVVPTIQARELTDRLEAMTTLAEVASRLRADGRSVDTCIRSGDAARLILETASLRDVGLIVMPTHGRDSLSRWLYGSSSESFVGDPVTAQGAPVLPDSYPGLD